MATDRREPRPWRVLTTDALAMLRSTPDASVDLVLTDPPYGLAPYRTGAIRLAGRTALNRPVAWDRPFDPRSVAAELRRVLKPTGNLFVFTGHSLFGRWHDALSPLFDVVQFAVWHRTTPVPSVRKVGFLSSCELIVCAWDRGHVWNFSTQRGMHNFVESPRCMGRERWREPPHPTQKPLAVLKRFIAIGSPNRGLVLDPYCGVGSTGVAALALGRRFLGCDADGRYVRAARRRLRGAQGGGSVRPYAA